MANVGNLERIRGRLPIVELTVKELLDRQVGFFPGLQRQYRLDAALVVAEVNVIGVPDLGAVRSGRSYGDGVDVDLNSQRKAVVRGERSRIGAFDNLLVCGRIDNRADDRTRPRRVGRPWDKGKAVRQGFQHDYGAAGGPIADVLDRDHVGTGSAERELAFLSLAN